MARKFKLSGVAWNESGTANIRVTMNSVEVYNGPVTDVLSSPADPVRTYGHLCEFDINDGTSGNVDLQITSTDGDIYIKDGEGNYICWMTKWEATGEIIPDTENIPEYDNVTSDASKTPTSDVVVMGFDELDETSPAAGDIRKVAWGSFSEGATLAERCANEFDCLNLDYNGVGGFLSPTIGGVTPPDWVQDEDTRGIGNFRFKLTTNETLMTTFHIDPAGFLDSGGDLQAQIDAMPYHQVPDSWVRTDY